MHAPAGVHKEAPSFRLARDTNMRKMSGVSEPHACSATKKTGIGRLVASNSSIQLDTVSSSASGVMCAVLCVRVPREDCGAGDAAPRRFFLDGAVEAFMRFSAPSVCRSSPSIARTCSPASHRARERYPCAAGSSVYQTWSEGQISLTCPAPTSTTCFTPACSGLLSISFT